MNARLHMAKSIGGIALAIALTYGLPIPYAAAVLPPCDTCTPPPPPSTPPPEYNPIGPITAMGALDSTNGAKAVGDAQYPKSLHLVYRDGADVQYRSSPDNGLFWSAPLTIAASASTPTIGIDDNNDLGVAYVSAGALYYRYRASGGAWSVPVQIANIAQSNPSIAGYGGRMHLAWSDGRDIKYASFPTLAPSMAVVESVTLSLVCANVQSKLPSIAVANSGGPDPLVRVAYYSRVACSGSNTVGLYVMERPAGGAASWPAFPPNNTAYVFGQTFQNPTSPNVSSVSLAANRSTKEFYLLASFTTGGLWKTTLAKAEPASGSIYASWKSVPYFGGDTSAPVIGDVVAVDVAGTVGWFKTAYSTGLPYGSTFLKQGLWTGALPAYWSSQLKSLSGRNADVIDFRNTDTTTGITKGVNVVYEFAQPYDLRADYFQSFPD